MADRARIEQLPNLVKIAAWKVAYFRLRPDPAVASFEERKAAKERLIALVDELLGDDADDA